MLTTLATIKARLGISVSDYDGILTSAIKAVSDRFHRECNRRLPRTADATHEFSPADTEVLPPCYPVESVTKFKLKSNETDGWTEQTGVRYLLRRACVISLLSPLSSSINSPVARLTYTGCYVLPGDKPRVRPRCPTTSNKPPSNKSPTGSATAIKRASSALGPTMAPTKLSRSRMCFWKSGRC